MKETRFFERFRAEHNNEYGYILSGRAGIAYLPITFKRTDNKMLVDDETRTIMQADPPSYNMIRNIYEKFGQLTGDESIMEQFSDLYDQANPIYTATNAIHYICELLESNGESYNVQIQNIGAEYLDGVGITDPLHTLELYRVVDNEYNVHYALSTSLAMLEAKSNELHNASTNDYNDDNMFGETDYDISVETLKPFIYALIQDYFHIDPNEVISRTQCTKLLVLAPDTTDFIVLGPTTPEKLHQVPYNVRIGMVVLTDEVYKPNLASMFGS